ncbi:galactokinase family protein [Spongiivirga sp. MCCC 1A20706]|uniref:mevalonate kinase family protein n=1 Tax=Spongiivirga sp. MCCC 1A20706 TaxID=3160963 RepID=UPI0039772E04
MKKEIVIKAPGRVCLFGDHQDYLDLPVIACAINRFVELKAVPNKTSVFNITMTDIGQERSIDIGGLFQPLTHHDYFASSLRVVRRYGCIPNLGYDITISGDLPINAGLSSSSALVVAWIRFLLTAFEADHSITDQFVGKLAYEAEVLEHHGSGGYMDQYSIALGGVVFIETSGNINFKRLEKNLNCSLIIGESGVKKETQSTLGNLSAKGKESFSLIKERNHDFNPITTSLEDVKKLSTHLPDQLQPIFYAAINNYQITQEALRIFEKNEIDAANLGVLMNEHHRMLKDHLKITVPLIDNMVKAALSAGAYGTKIVGSGGGGCIVALVDQSKANIVICEIKKAGAKDAYQVSIV